MSKPGSRCPTAVGMVTVALVGASVWSWSGCAGDVFDTVVGPLRGLGKACPGAAFCASGLCVDSVCCDSACDGACKSCNLLASPGHCSPVMDAQDPGICDANTAADDCTATPCSCAASGLCQARSAPSACDESIQIDGHLDEEAWSNAPALVNRVVMGTGGGVSGQLRWHWNAGYLFVAAAVADSALVNDSADVWQDDSVEIYLDIDHNQSTTYLDDDFQLILGWGDTAVFEAFGRNDGIVSAQTTTPDGYTVEVAIPWSTVGATPTTGSSYGFDLGINVDDDGDNRDHQLMWHGTFDNYRDTSGFGSIVLAPDCSVSPTP